MTALTTGLSSGGPDAAHAQAGWLVPVPYRDHTGTITANWHEGPGNTQVDEGILTPVAFNGFNGIDPQVSTEVAPTVRVGNGVGMPQVHTYAGVRRLTPRECERLQGFPDDWTLLDEADRVIADTHRYRFMGNAVTVPVIEWIGRRIRIAAARDRALVAA